MHFPSSYSINHSPFSLPHSLRSWLCREFCPLMVYLFFSAAEVEKESPRKRAPLTFSVGPVQDEADAMETGSAPVRPDPPVFMVGNEPPMVDDRTVDWNELSTVEPDILKVPSFAPGKQGLRPHKVKRMHICIKPIATTILRPVLSSTSSSTSSTCRSARRRGRWSGGRRRCTGCFFLCLQ